MTNKNEDLKAFVEGFNLIGKVVILKPEYAKSGIPYVFKIFGGSGASDGNIGTGIFGEFLTDGEQAKIRAGDILRLATDTEIEDKEVSLLTLGGMYKNLEVESEIGHLSFQIVKLSLENDPMWEDMRQKMEKIEIIEDSSKSNAEQLKALKEYYKEIDPYS